MADFIDAAEAKKILGCDDATLSNYVNNGTVRAQHEGGQLKLLREDVVNLAGTTGSDSDDGTIILSGDSEDLSIDLGEVVDDSAVTMVQTRSDEQSDSITFGDELEVVKFDESHTEELSFEDSDATQSLTFTDSNTAIGTDPEGSAVGTATATATSDFQTVDYGEEAGAASGAGGTMRRSVRSQRVRFEKPKTHWIWPTVLVLNLLITALWVVPYFFMMLWPQEKAYYKAPLEITESVKSYDRYFISGEQRRGVIDGGIWSSLAEGVAGFSIEPDEETHRARTNGESEWRSIDVESQGICPAVWRYQQYRKGAKPEDVPDFWTIDSVTRAEDGAVDSAPAMKKATSAESKDDNGGTLKSFPVAPKAIDGLGEGTRIELPVWSHK